MNPGAASGSDATSEVVDELQELVTEHSDAVYRLALSIVRDPSLAEDIAQETMVKAWIALPTLRNRAALRGWILRIAHNTSISTIRSRRAELERGLRSLGLRRVARTRRRECSDRCGPGTPRRPYRDRAWPPPCA